MRLIDEPPLAIARSRYITYNQTAPMTALKVILILLVSFILWLVVIRIARRLYRFPAPVFIGRFLDSDFRRWLQPPDKVIERSGIKPGMTAMELGCGDGAFTTFAARVIGESGKLYAVDIQAKMLKQLQRKLARPGNQDIRNMELKQAAAYDLPFEKDSLDLVYLVTVLQEIPDIGRALREIKRVLKPGGVLAVTEFFPDPDYPLSSTTIKMGQRECLLLDDKLGNFWNYTVRFKKPLAG